MPFVLKLSNRYNILVGMLALAMTIDDTKPVAEVLDPTAAATAELHNQFAEQ